MRQNVQGVGTEERQVCVVNLLHVGGGETAIGLTGEVVDETVVPISCGCLCRA